MASDRTPKTNPFLFFWTPPSVLLLFPHSRATPCFVKARKIQILILITSTLNLRMFVMPKWLLMELAKTSPNKPCISHSMSPTYSNDVHQALVTPKLSNKAWVRAGLALGWFVRFSPLWKTYHSHMHSKALHAIVPVTWAQVRKTAESPGDTRGCWEKPL